MRKFLFFAIALIASATMMAAGGDGSSKSAAIHFDWDGANKVEANTTTWYRLGLSDLSERANDPVIALYLNNLTAEQAEVKLSACAVFKVEFLNQKIEQEFSIAPKSYQIEGGGHDIWTLPTTFDLTEQVSGNKLLQKIIKDPANVSLLELCGYGVQVYLEVKTDKQIDIATTIYEKEEIVDDACTSAVDFYWAGETVAAGEKWFYLNLAAVKSANQKLNFVVTNNAAAEAQVAFDLYLDCPASAIALDYDWTIPAGGEKKEALGRFLLNQITNDYVYLKLTTTQEITLKAEAEALPVVDPTLFDATGAETLGDKLSLNAGEKKIRKVIVDDLKAPKGYKTVCSVVNNGATDVTLTQEVSMEAVAKESATDVKTLTVAAGTKTTIDIPSKMLATIKNDVVYFRFAADGQLTILIDQVPVATPSKPTIVAPACDESYVFDWNSTIKQSAFTTKWYEFDIAPLKQNNEQVQLTFTNHSDSMVVVMGSILSDCQSKDTIPYILPIPAGKSVSQFINYNLLAASLLEKIYVSATVIPTTITGVKDLTSISSKADLEGLISMDANVEIEFTAAKSSALVDPALCNTHETFQHGVKYTQAAGTTKWYRVTEDFIKNELGLLASLTVENQGSSAAHVTLGATIGCDYGVISRTTVAIPTWFDLTTLFPSGLYYLIDKVTNKEITEFYLEVTTDQPIMFGFGVEYGNAFGCDDATNFDWATGTTIPANDAKWYKFDVTDLKNNEEQVKLTFTNTSNSIAWVAAFLTHECPFYVGLPLVFPVPAGMSVDKWIDYSFIASTPINTVYMAVYTDSNIELKAEKESAAKITPVTGCLDATVVEPNVQYTINPGTSWYKFSATPFINATGKSATLSFANKSGKTAHVTTGATVGCEYGILTRGKLPVPQMDVDVTVPLWVFGVMKQFVDDRVDQYYVEVTTDEPLNFQIAVEIAEDSIPEEPVFPEDSIVYHLNDTVYEYVCEGTDYTHPITAASFKVFNDTILVDTLATADTLLFEVYVYDITAVKAPIVMTDSILVAIGAAPVLTQGLLPDTAGTIAIIKQYYADNDTANVANVNDIYWKNADKKVDCDATEHTMTLILKADCDNEMKFDLELPVISTAAFDTTVVVECDEYTWAQTGTTYKTSGMYYDTVANAISGCMNQYFILDLTISQSTKATVNDTVYPYQLPYKWNGKEYNVAGEYIDTLVNAAGCDSIVTIKLIVDSTVIRAEVNIVDTVCAGTEYQGRLTKKTINQSETWTDSVHVNVAGVPTDSIYNYTIIPFEVSLATVSVDDIIVICGNAIDVTKADSIVRAHVAAKPLYATLENVLWEVKNAAGNWETLTTTAIDGSVTSVEIRYTIQTACEDVTSDPIVITVQTPTPENDEEMTNIPLYSRYGDRLLTVDLKKIQDEYGWVVAEEDITWYYVAQGAEPVELGHGYYLTPADGAPLNAGSYYARINHTRVVPSECDGILQTVTYIVNAPSAAPKLVPTVARPQELISVLNLDPASVTAITIYSTTGEVITSFQVNNQEQTTFPAAQNAGFYVVDVQTATEKVSLRYIVK